MTKKPSACIQIEEDLLAAAVGEAPADTQRLVERHVAVCAPCRHEFDGYRALERTVAALRSEPLPDEQASEARARLDTRLSDLRRRLLTYRIFPSPLGHILIARSETGISSVEYLERGTSIRASHLIRQPGVEVVKAGQDLEGEYQDLVAYLQGRSRRIEWPLDLRLARSDFQRSVLEATAAIPYGAVVSYAGLARDIGKAEAVRAVAQALRWNPLPIVIPCHRVIGSSGALTGYAGNKLSLKQRLLALEGVPTTKGAGAPAIRPQDMYAVYPGMPAYCLPTCSFLGMAPPAPLTRFASREHAEGAGLDPCGICRPDLHPIPN